jgi:hypothetical protein
MKQNHKMKRSEKFTIINKQTNVIISRRIYDKLDILNWNLNWILVIIKYF